MTDTDTNQEQQTSETVPAAKANDQGSISVSGFVRIFDPKTDETIVEIRA